MSLSEVTIDRSKEVIYGLLILAGVEVALPLSALREVVPCPTEFADLPASADGLLGAMTLRELVVPVLDLRPRLGVPAERTEDQVVAIIVRDDQVLGLLADEARGVTRVSEADLRSVHAEDGPLLFSDTFRHPSLGCVVSVLHVPTVLHLPGVATVHDPTAARGGAPQVTSRRAGPRRTLTLLRCDQHVLGIDVAHVHTTLAGAYPKHSVLDSAMCQGVTQYTDHEVNVIDPLVLLGLGQLPADATGAGLVLKLDQGYVVLALSTLVDIAEVASEDVLPMPTFAVRRPELLAGIADVEGSGQCLILDGDALHADRDLQAFAALNTPVAVAADEKPRGLDASADQDDASVAVGGPVHLTYSVGVDVATPLEQVSEIIAFPETRTPTDVGEAVLGVAVHRRAAVPVLCLPTLLGLPRPSVTSAACVLLVQVDDDLVGFAVETLRSIDPLVWEEKHPAEGGGPGTTKPMPEVSRALRKAPLVSVGDDTRLLRNLDLRAVAREVRRDMSPAMALSA